MALTWVESVVRRGAGLLTPNRTILAAPLAMSILFALIVAAGLIASPADYFILFAMVLTSPLRLLLIRLGLRDKV